MLNSLSISHFKGFLEQQTLDFAQPNGELGSGLTVIVGENNSGKSTIFDALLKLHTLTLPIHERHTDGDFKLELNAGIKNETYTLTNPDGAQLVCDKRLNDITRSMHYIQSRRYWNHQFTRGKLSIGQYWTDKLFTEKHHQRFDNALGQLLESFNANHKLRVVFDTYLKNICDDFNEWSIDKDEIGFFIQYKSKNGTYHKANLFGDGIISIFRILAVLVDKCGDTILIDEPELSLHPHAQKILSKLFSEISKDIQIVLATHSPYFINWSDFHNGAKLVRTSKNADIKCELNSLNNDANYFDELINFSDDWQKPQLMDTAAKEIFFARNVVFLEGQEDVGLLRRFVKENNLSVNFDFYGYGSGGSGNIKYFLEMAKDIGVSAAAIFDRDKEEEKNKCEHNFPKFKLILLPVDDIRDKHKKDANCKDTDEIKKEGYFNRHGQIKAKHKDKLKSIIDELIIHFQTD